MSNRFNVGDLITHLQVGGVEEVLEVLVDNTYVLKTITPSLPHIIIGYEYISAKNIEPNNRLITPLEKALL